MKPFEMPRTWSTEWRANLRHAAACAADVIDDRGIDRAIAIGLFERAYLWESWSVFDREEIGLLPVQHVAQMRGLMMAAALSLAERHHEPAVASIIAAGRQRRQLERAQQRAWLGMPHQIRIEVPPR